MFGDDLSANGERFLEKVKSIVELETLKTNLPDPTAIKDGTILIVDDKTLAKEENKVLGKKFPRSVVDAKDLILLKYSNNKIAEYKMAGFGHQGEMQQSPLSDSPMGIAAYQWNAELLFFDIESGKQYGYKTFTAQDPEEMEMNLLSVERYSKKRASQKIKELVNGYFELHCNED